MTTKSGKISDVVANHETIIISRKGKPAAQPAPIPSGAYQDEVTRFQFSPVDAIFSDF